MKGNYSTFMIYWISILRVVISLEMGLFWSKFLDTLWMDSTPDETAATSSSSKKITLLVCSIMAEASDAKKYSTFSPGRQREISSPWGPEDVMRNSADVFRGVALPEVAP